MMHHKTVDVLVAGQGIAGTLLSYELLQAGYKVMVLDRGQPAGQQASRVAGAIINPLSGKHWQAVPEGELTLSQALATYRSLEALLHTTLLQERALYLFPGAKDLVAHLPAAQQPELELYFTDTQGVKHINGLWQVAAGRLLDAWRAYLLEQAAFLPYGLDYDRLHFTAEHILYEGIKARYLVFCEGAAGAHNPWFAGLPFTPNRGDVLLLSIPGLPQTALYQRGVRLIPLGKDLFWCGSNYRWKFADLAPDAAWRQEVCRELQDWLRLPVNIVDHQVALRPTTAGQRVLVGRSGVRPRLMLFNGLGTRGFSTGPYWARWLSLRLSDENLPYW